MAPRIFMTGVTGYIIGDAFKTIHDKHPDYEYTLLIRSEDKASKVKAKYPDVKTVIGNNDSSDLIEAETAKADIVLHGADSSDHEGAARAILAGLKKGHSASNPGYYIHTSGTGVLCFTDTDNKTLGAYTDKQYNDLDGVTELTSLPDHAFHRIVDKIVLDGSAKNGDVVKTCIVCPPTIYGQGRGPISGHGRQAYTLASTVLKTKKAPIIGPGKARWTYVHIADLSSVFLLLVDSAVSRSSDPQIWGPNGYFLTETGEHYWAELAEEMARYASGKGYIPKTENMRQVLSEEEAMEIGGFEAVSWGLNSRGKSGRARKFLGWEPKEKSLFDEVPVIVETERERMSGSK